MKLKRAWQQPIEKQSLQLSLAMGKSNLGNLVNFNSDSMDLIWSANR